MAFGDGQIAVCVSRVSGATTPFRHQTIGMKKITQPRMKLNERSNDLLIPTAPVPSQPTVGSGVFECEAPGCSRSFATARGRGVHQRSAHPDWCDARNASVPHVKERWSDEERRLLARKEAELTLKGVRFMNIELVKVTDRSLESIKGQRKRADHKQLVEQYVREMEDVQEVSSTSSDSSVQEYLSAEESADEVDPFALCLSSWSRIDNNRFGGQQFYELCQTLSRRSKVDTLAALALFLKEFFCEQERHGGARRPAPREDGNFPSKRARRRAKYVKTQYLWRKNPGQCVQRILSDQTEQEDEVPKDIMVPYWKAVFEGSSLVSPTLSARDPPIEELWSPITTGEIKGAFPPLNTAVGPDGLKVGTLRSAPLPLIAGIFNMLMYCGELPQHLNSAHTVLIPKRKGATEPGDFRPITISSVLVRTFHKVLANRLNRLISLDERQRAFRDTDGCSDNVMLLDMALKYHHSRFKPLFVSLLDMAKAFDSVSHKALNTILSARGIPTGLRNYILRTYERGVTKLHQGSWESEDIHPSCGVKQGDPLSPFLFNLVMDCLLKSTTTDIGINIDGLKLNILAFADDLVLLASTSEGLQTLIDHVASFLGKCGLRANSSKCLSLAIKNVPKQKKSYVDPSCRFKIQGALMPSLKRTDQWKYLGVSFTADGRSKVDLRSEIDLKISKVSKAPLKPQQKLWALKHIIIPSSMYKLSMGGVPLGYLRSIDKRVRSWVRKWLYLPHDCPNAYFHATTADGGLGVPSVRWLAPLERLNKIIALERSHYISGAATDTYLSKERRIAEQRLRDETALLKTISDINGFWAKLLYAKFDGMPLTESKKVPEQHRWLSKCTRFFSGRDYINCCKLRINAMPTRSRTARGRAKDRSCRGGCLASETLDHVLQKCHRTHAARIKRHDAISKFVAKRLTKAGYSVDIEPRIKTASGLLKPDVVATSGQTALVIDAQVITDQFDLDRANKEKVKKYSGMDFVKEIKATSGMSEVTVLAVTLNWRGIWSKRSASKLLQLGILRKEDITILSSRVLIGGVAAFHQFGTLTSVRRGWSSARTAANERRGVG